MDLGMSR